MSKHGKPVSDDELTLLYYGEHDDPELPARVAASAALSRRLEELSAELNLADQYQPPERGDDYGAEVWRKIEPRITPRDAARGAGHATQRESIFAKISRSLAQPRFSLAGAFGLVLVASIAFVLGRNSGPADPATSPEAGIGPAIALADIDRSALLQRSVSGHLEQVNQVLTRFVNLDESSAAEAERATDLLVANRLYRRSAASGGDRKLASFLAELEPLLIELAHEAHTASSHSRDRMRREVSEGLLFRVRVMNNRLRNTTEQSSEIST
jgi:hypothetical protein